jgi:peptide/nickel transport system ATP-binding protein
LQTKPDVATDRETVIDIKNLSVHFALRGGSFSRLFGRDTGTIRAVEGVNLQLQRGEVIGLVGESGSGKSTLGRALLGLVPAAGGSIMFKGEDIAEMSKSDLREIRRDVQMVFQDPNAALNPAMTVEAAVGDALRVHGMSSADERRPHVISALERVGLSPVELFLTKYPRDLSGGQKQRVVLARAIIMDPSVLVADEPISMLDMSVRAKILQLMLDLKEQLGLSYVYITHDLASAKFFCDRIAIMYLGKIVELGSTDQIFNDPKHPYTRALLAAIPEPDPSIAKAAELLRGEIPDAAQPPAGCAFHPRCPAAFDKCGWESRDLVATIESHWLRSGVATFESERQELANLEELRDQRGGSAVLKPAGSASTQDLRTLLDEARSEDPEARFWTGVSEIVEEGTGLEVKFHPGEEPELRPTGGVEVSCHLYT